MTSWLTPHITEKSYRAATAESGSAYTFGVPVPVRAEAARAAIEREYGVHVTAIRTQRIPGKLRRFKGIVGRTQDQKRVIVTLKKGERIAAFDIDTSKAGEQASAS